MKKIKILGLSLALALLLLLTVVPCAQAADMDEGSYYAIGHLYPPGATIWAYAYYLHYTAYGTLMVQSHSWYAVYIMMDVAVRYANGTLATPPGSGMYFGPTGNGVSVSNSLLNPPSGGYVDLGAATYWYMVQNGKPIYIVLGGDEYDWYY